MRKIHSTPLKTAGKGINSKESTTTFIYFFLKIKIEYLSVSLHS